MTHLTSMLVVLIDADDVKHVFDTWPDHICLATCLTREGECHMVVFRRDDRAVIHQRLMQTLQINSDEVCFVPRVAGFATKQFRYSDERRLMALVATDPDLLEEALDYSVNYSYALEEGLDPVTVLGGQAVAVPPPRRLAAQLATAQRRVEPLPAARRELSPLLPDFLRKSAERARRPRFASVRKAKIEMLVPQT